MASIFYSCKNDKTVNKDTPTSKEQEVDTKQTEVLTLGSFHVKFLNLDIVKTDKSNQINILDLKHQKEIELIVNKLAKFKPTKIVIERQPEKQQIYDSIYTSYLKVEHQLSQAKNNK